MRLRLPSEGRGSGLLAALRRRLTPRVLRVTTVLVIALATGHVMQQGDARAGLFEPPLPPAPPAAPDAHRVGALTEITAVVPVSAPIDPFARPGAEGAVGRTPPPPLAPPAGQRPLPAAAAPAQPETAGGCALQLDLAPAEGAMLHLALSAPCHPGAEAEIVQGALRFRAKTDEQGRLVLDLPALASPAAVAAVVAGSAAVAGASVPDLAGFDRVALVWQGEAAPELHAYEEGAGFGDPGHVWAGAPGGAGAAGKLLRLGDPGLSAPALAEVYSVPAARGPVRIEVQAAITAASCGHPLAAALAATFRGEAAAPVALQMAMPACDGLGGYVVLDDPIPPQHLAAR